MTNTTYISQTTLTCRLRTSIEHLHDKDVPLYQSTYVDRFSSYFPRLLGKDWDGTILDCTKPSLTSYPVQNSNPSQTTRVFTPRAKPSLYDIQTNFRRICQKNGYSFPLSSLCVGTHLYKQCPRHLKRYTFYSHPIPLTPRINNYLSVEVFVATTPSLESRLSTNLEVNHHLRSSQNQWCNFFFILVFF